MHIYVLKISMMLHITNMTCTCMYMSSYPTSVRYNNSLLYHIYNYYEANWYNSIQIDTRTGNAVIANGMLHTTTVQGK